MKVLLYGANGWIGGMFADLYEKDEIFPGYSRVDDEKAVLKEIQKVKPDRVVCMTGRTHGEGVATIDYLESNEKLQLNVNDNLFSPVVLALICQRLDIHFTYLGTGCIFSYDDEQEIFREDDEPNFFGSNYSIVKGYTDRLMHHTNALNIRIRMPIVDHDNPRNFITKIKNYEKVVNIQNSVTILPVLLPKLKTLIAQQAIGTFNFTNPGTISHNEVLEMYKELVDNSIEIKNFSIEEQDKILLSKRSNNHLDTKKLETYFPDLLNVKNELYLMLSNWKRQ